MDESDRGGMLAQEKSRQKDTADEVVFKDSSFEKNNQDWPYEEILSLNSSDACPVVFDTSIPKDMVSSSLKASKKKKGSQQLTDSLPLGHSSTTSEVFSPNSNSSNDTSLFYDSNGSTELAGRETMANVLMKERESEYTQLHNYRIFCGTWNVNDQPADRIKEWLSPHEDKEPPDIYVIGLQEMDLSKNLYLFTESAKERVWLGNIHNALHHKASYKMIEQCRMVAMLMVVYVKQSLQRHVRDLYCESVGTGIFGMMGNKGAVSVRFMLRETSVCFVNSHLAAHTEELERRNQDFKDINSKLCFRINDRILSISDHDVVFWLGDLNYRISGINIDDVNRHLSTKDYQELLNFDQLHRQKNEKAVFNGYKEGAITFEPTYKYIPGTNTRDPERTPAWCDRVLWKGQHVEQLLYRSHPDVNLSDHKPVSSVFTMGTKMFDRKLERVVRESVMKLLDQQENDFLPQVSLSSLEVNFENLKYLDTQQKSITLVNIGQAPVKFNFSNKPNQNSPCKPWLNIQPFHGFVPIGKSKEIMMEVQINSKTVHDWQAMKIEDIVVLHLEGGKDLFVTITATCMPSFFGLPLSKLICMHSPVALNNTPDPSVSPLGVPKELWFIIDYLYKNGMKQEKLFQVLGLEKEIKMVRDQLDSKLNGLTGSKYHIHSVAETLLIFLDSLPQPVIPYQQYHACISASTPAQKTAIIQRLPTCHRNVFQYLCAFLNEHLRYTLCNKNDIHTLSQVFSGVLLKATHKMNYERLAEENDKRTSFLEFFLTNGFA